MQHRHATAAEITRVTARADRRALAHAAADARLHDELAAEVGMGTGQPIEALDRHDDYPITTAPQDDPVDPYALLDDESVEAMLDEAALLALEPDAEPVDAVAAKAEDVFVGQMQAHLDASRQAQTLRATLRRADAAAPETTIEPAETPARIVTLSDHLSATTRDHVGACHVSITPRLHHAGRAAAAHIAAAHST